MNTLPAVERNDFLFRGPVIRSVFTALAALLLCSCATTGLYVMSEAVGPTPGASSYGKEGMLQVFTVTTQVNDGGIPYFPHTSYRVYSTNGSFVKYVRNHTSATDQRPDMVKLPAGNYSVTATSETMGVVKVPVLIRGSQITVVYLDRGEMKEARGADEKQLVLFPNGKVVGWKAPAPQAK